MELLCVLFAVAALFCGCAVLTLKCRVPAAVAPLTALSLIVAVLTLAAMAGVLYPAAWAVYGLCLAGGVWVLATRKKHTDALQMLFTPGSVLFWGMALAFTVYFFVRQPMATDFDELSLWATAVKITKVNNDLYATAELGTPWAATQNPGLPLLAYFFQFLGDYADWKIYVGYDILYFSVFAAVVGAIPRSKWRVAVPMAAALWCVPFFFTNYNHTIYLTTTYMTSYGDVPAGLVFGGAVAAWCRSDKLPAHSPSQIVSYVSAHDNFTLWDKLMLVRYARPEYTAADSAALAQNRLAAGIYLTCMGMPFLQAGEEFARTKKGQGNTYRSSPSLNRLDWKRAAQFHGLVDYYRGLLGLRAQFPRLSASDAASPAAIKFFSLEQPLVGWTLPAAPGDSAAWRALCVFYNPTEEEKRVRLPDGQWKLLSDGVSSALWKGPSRVCGGEVTLLPYSATIFGQV